MKEGNSQLGDKPILKEGGSVTTLGVRAYTL